MPKEITLNTILGYLMTYPEISLQDVEAYLCEHIDKPEVLLAVARKMKANSSHWEVRYVIATIYLIIDIELNSTDFERLITLMYDTDTKVSERALYALKKHREIFQDEEKRTQVILQGTESLLTHISPHKEEFGRMRTPPKVIGEIPKRLIL
jgi:hypothetical protein